MENCIIVGHRIKARREALGINQSELERRTGLTRQQIINIESGKSLDPLSSTLIKLSDALDCTVDYLLAQSVNPN